MHLNLGLAAGGNTGGAIDTPLLHMPLKDSLVLQQGTGSATFTRTTTGTYTNQTTGLVTSAAIDEARFESSFVTSQNLLTRSEEFDDAVWVAASTTVTANTGTGADGTTSADRLQYVGSLGTPANRRIQQAVTPSGGTASKDFTVSIWARSKTGTSKFRLKNTHGGVIDNFSPDITITGTTLSRHDFTVTNSAAAGSGTQTVGIVAAIDDSAYDLEIWGAQVEESDLVTPYLRTVASPRTRKLGLATNLLLRSEEFDDAAWVETNTTVTANATADPNGSVTADKLKETTAAASHLIAALGSTISGNTYTISVFAKAAEQDWVQLTYGFGGFGSNSWANFNVATGALGNAGSTVISQSITPLSDGWYRCTVTAAATSTQASTGVADIGLTNNLDSSSRLPSYTGDGTSGVFIWGAQLEEGVLEPGPYAATTTAAASIATGGSSQGVLIEGASENLLLRSEEFDNAAWVKTASTLSPDAITAPDGNTTADRWVLNATTEAHALGQSETLSAGVYTLTVFAKAAERDLIQLVLSTALSSEFANFDLTNGTVTAGTNISASIEAVANGFFRCSVTFTSLAATGNILLWAIDSPTDIRTANSTGDGTDGIYVWGAQLEELPFASSYIPTVASTVTRGADDLSVPTTGNFDETQGTISFDYDTLGVDGDDQVVLEVSDVSADNRHQLFLETSTDKISMFVADATVQQVFEPFPTSLIPNKPTEIVYSYRLNDFAGYQDKILEVTDSLGSVPTGLTSIQIGNLFTGSLSTYGHIKDFKTSPQVLTLAQISKL